MRGTIDDLLELVRRLRAPDGCPWDREQTLQTVRAYLLEEAHEAAHAIDENDPQALRAELGDLLFQVAFVGVLAEEQGEFRLADSIRTVHRKMVARHPHVFATSLEESNSDLDAAEVSRRWEARKASEKRAGESLLDGIAPTLPALTAAYRLGQKAAGVGFDWPDIGPVLDKVREELTEVEAEIAADPSKTQRRRLEEEVGDLLFAIVNLARHLALDPEASLARTNAKFRRRFAFVEAELRRRDRDPTDSSLEEMDAIWNAAKADEAR
ncbi:MAG: nucleoside triphosphate pyrophosphohydrolase [Thermoanaerobaculia bacterium]|nr:nucleoside triphosphate pyrophosphohydrolase [Thermoanaerobaculia bacterium]